MKMVRHVAPLGRTMLVVMLIILVWLSGLVFSWADGVTPTNEWINLYSTNSTVDGDPVPPGAVVSVFDSGGAKCGETEVTEAGWYGLMPCYRAPADSGGGHLPRGSQDAAADGESLSFTVDGLEVQYETVSLNATPVPRSTEVTWTALGDVWEVDLHSRGETRPVGGYSIAAREVGMEWAQGASVVAAVVTGLGLTVFFLMKARDGARGG